MINMAIICETNIAKLPSIDFLWDANFENFVHFVVPKIKPKIAAKLSPTPTVCIPEKNFGLITFLLYTFC